jgi:hypothetical protein
MGEFPFGPGRALLYGSSLQAIFQVQDSPAVMLFNISSIFL